MVFNREKGFLYALRGGSSVQYFCVSGDDVIVSYADCTIGLFRRGDDVCVR